MEIGQVHPTLSPSMDIQVSSNFERLLFDLYGRDGGAVAEAMTGLRARPARLALDPAAARPAARPFSPAIGSTMTSTLATMAALYRETGELIDPHSAIGVAAARAERLDPDIADGRAGHRPSREIPRCGRAARPACRPALPPALADLYARPERFTVAAQRTSARSRPMSAMQVAKGEAA